MSAAGTARGKSPSKPRGKSPSKSRGKASGKPHSKSHGKAGDDGFVQFIKNPDTRMRAVVTACGHGG